MVTDKVIDGHAYYVCTECGKKRLILEWFYDEDKKYTRLHSIDRINDNGELFRAQHSLCKSNLGKQLEL